MADLKELQSLFHQCMPLFIALGDEVRLTIIETLTGAGIYDNRGLNVAEGLNGYSFPKKRGMNVNEITRETNLSRPAISHHLKILKDAGLVDIRREKTSNYYFLTIADGTDKLKALCVGLRQLLDGI